MSKIALVVGSRTSPSVGAVSVRDRLVDVLGHTVTYVDDGDAVPADILGYDAVVIHSSVNGTTLGNKYNPVAVPLLICDQGAVVANSLDGSAGVNNTGTTIEIEDDRNFLAAGLSGTVTVLTGSGTIQSADSSLPSTATLVATRTGNDSRATIFGYVEGDEMQSGFIAPHRRLFFFAQDLGVSNLTADGLTLFDRAVQWTLNGPWGLDGGGFTDHVNGGGLVYNLYFDSVSGLLYRATVVNDSPVQWYSANVTLPDGRELKKFIIPPGTNESFNFPPSQRLPYETNDGSACVGISMGTMRTPTG